MRTQPDSSLSLSFLLGSLLWLLRFPRRRFSAIIPHCWSSAAQLTLTSRFLPRRPVTGYLTNMKTFSAILLASLLTRPVLGALVGYGIYPYSPPCAFACHRSLSSLTLQCSSDMASGSHMGGHSDMISPQCRAGDTSWLTTLAWCMRTKCADYHISTSNLEAFWEVQSTGDSSVAPKWGYSTTLFNIAQTPTRELTRVDDSLNSTVLVNPAVYEAQYNALTAVQRENVVESGFGYENYSCTGDKACQTADS